MKIKVYVGCAVDGHNGIYTPMVFAQRYPSFVLPESLKILLAGPDSEDYTETSAGDFICNSGDVVFEYNDCGDILEYQLIDSDKITIGELNEYSRSENFNGLMQVIETSYGHCDIAQIGENCLCRVSLSNAGIISADHFFEMDDYFSFNENLQTFAEDIAEVLKAEFEKDHDIYTLPAYWASALINGDYSGYEDNEIAEIQEFERLHGYCVGCGDDSWFASHSDVNSLGGDVKEFYFPRVENEK